MEFPHDPAATPLDPDEAEGLLPSHISTQGDLNAWEQANILEGEQWASRQKKRDLLEEAFVRDLHRQMFGRTWRWAGAFRTSNKNIGVDWAQVPIDLRNLLDDARYQVINGGYNPDEIALRFHQRLVWIHPFPNGNGRHARLMADLLIVRLGRPRFTWGDGNAPLTDSNELRARYIAALRSADRGRFEALFSFARS